MKFAIAFALLFVPAIAKAQTSTINWGTTFQTIDGFGAYFNTTDSISSGTADLLFSTTSGIGLSLLRTQVPENSSNSGGNCTTAGTGCSGFNQLYQYAVARGAKMWATSWTPPASMKSNGSNICDTGSGESHLNTGSYAAFATWQSNYIASMAAQGTPLFAISVANEPDFCPSGSSGANWTAATFDTYVKNNLGPTMAGAGQTTRIIIPEPTGYTALTPGSVSTFADTCMNDSGCATYIGTIASHGYCNNPNYCTTVPGQYTNGGKPLWETEFAAFTSPYDNTITDALTVSQQIYGWMTSANASAWHWWYSGTEADNEGLFGGSFTVPLKRLYAIGNWSKFVRPGYVRIGASNPTSGVLISAYKDPGSGNFAIVAVNTNGSPSGMTFAFSGFTSSTTVTPWLTSASSNLVAQTPISAGTGFSATLAANSITTFVGGPGSGGTCVGFPWCGVIAPTRAIDWTLAGIPGGLPDGAWTQCGSTIAPYSGSDATISNALAACAANHYVLLGAGTFTITSQINFPANTTGHVVLRGSGANSTFIVGTTNGGASIRLNSNDGTFRGEDNAAMNIKNWTAGYAQGATQITLSDVSGIVANQSMLVLSQCDTGFSGQYCLTGTSTDNNGYFICATPWTSTGIGCNIANESADGPSWRCQGTNCGAAWQEEQVLVTAINQGGCGATCVTISHPLHSPNWSSGQYPVAIVIQGNPQMGVENLSIDGNNGAVNVGISTFNTYQAWVSQVRVVNMQSRGIDDAGSNTLIQSNYVFGNPINYNDDTGIHCNTCANEIVQNNIVQWPRIGYFADGPNPDSVIAYNYMVNAYSDDDHLHGSGNHAGPSNNFNLWEGNVFTNLTDYDSDHGGHLTGTFFRNFFTGWESCANGNCGSFTAKDFNTHGPEWDYASRYQNVVGNVWGTPGYHTIYSSNNRFDTMVIYEFGGAYGAQPFDPLVQSTSMLWGNWDVVTNATRWCGNSSDTGWSTTCGSTSEVPTGAPSYPNFVPMLGDTGAGQGVLPASFYILSKPSWFGSIPWPVIGPDVSSGTVGQCGGTFNVAGKYNGTPATTGGQCAGSGLNFAWAGHVNANPAMKCFFSMGGVPDGTGSVLAFTPDACYGTPPPPAAPATPFSSPIGIL